MEMMIQMMINLTVNSNKHMQNGEFTIEVKKEKGGDYLTLLVSDAGCGVPPENAENIFTKGFSTNGTKGLGLSSARK